MLNIVQTKLALLSLLSIFSSSIFSQELPIRLPAWVHLPNTVDAYNLAILPNGTFRWNADGCDYGIGGAGLWKQEADMLVFYASGSKGFHWTTHGWVREVLVKSHNSGIQTTIANTQYEPQIWEPGLVCAQCEGSLLGPTGQPIACSNKKEEFKKSWLSKPTPANSH